MSVTNTLRRAGPFASNGVQTAFAFEFKVFTDADLLVVLTEDGVETTAVLGADYSVTLNPDQNDDPGGTVTFSVAPDGPSVTILSNVEETQPAVYTNTGGFYPKTVENSVDRATILTQQLSEKVDRAVLRPVDATAYEGYVPRVVAGELVLVAPDDFNGADGVNADGAISAEAYGVVGYLTAAEAKAGTDNRAALELAIAAAVAAGGGTITFHSPFYGYAADPRTQATDDITTGLTGLGLVIDGAHVTFKSACGGTRIFRRAQGMADPNTWANWPLLSGGGHWRGGGLFLKGQAAIPTDFARRSGVTLDGVLFDGGITKGASSGAVNLSTGDGWDETDKGIWMDNRSPQITTGGDVRLLNGGGAVGFRGEVMFGDNAYDNTFVSRGGITGETNAQCLNLNGMNWDIDGHYGYNAYFAIEAYGRGRISHAKFKDCTKGGTLQGGSHITNPTRFVSDEVPWIDFDDVTFENCGAGADALNLGSWLRGRMAFIDCDFVIGNSFTVAEEINLEITMVQDQVNNLRPDIHCGTTGGGLYIDNVNLDITFIRTAVAQTAGRKFASPLDYYGSFGPDIRVKVTAPDGIFTHAPRSLAAVPDNKPLVVGQSLNGSGTTLTTQTTVASATTVSLPRIISANTLMCVVSGTTAITGLTADEALRGVLIILRFEGVLTFTDGNNLKLNGNFATSADDTITLIHDGTNFYEVARSAN